MFGELLIVAPFHHDLIDASFAQNLVFAFLGLTLMGRHAFHILLGVASKLSGVLLDQLFLCKALLDPSSRVHISKASHFVGQIDSGFIG